MPVINVKNSITLHVKREVLRCFVEKLRPIMIAGSVKKGGILCLEN